MSVFLGVEIRNYTSRPLTQIPFQEQVAFRLGIFFFPPKGGKTSSQVVCSRSEKKPYSGKERELLLSLECTLDLLSG